MMASFTTLANGTSTLYKPPFKIGQIVELKKLKGARPGQKGEIIRAEKSQLLEGK